MKTCAVSECNSPARSLALCVKHYTRFKRTGTTDLITRARQSDSPCSVEGCDTPAKTRGMCGVHTERLRNQGTTDLTADNPECRIDGCTDPRSSRWRCHAHADELYRGLVRKRFDTGYEIQPGTLCWIWKRGMHSAGYGLIAKTYAHRYSYEIHNGPIPAGYVIDHLCRTEACVNPAHLEAVPQRINMLRGTAPGAMAVQLNRCKWGHEFTPDNTYYRPDDGTRQCRVCIKRRAAEATDRRRAAA